MPCRKKLAEKITPRALWQVLKESFEGFTRHRLLKLSASLAYYTVFSVGPLLICIIFLANIFYGREAIEGRIFGEIKNYVGANAAAQIQEIIRNASLKGEQNLAAVIGFITLLIGATTVFAEIQDSINSIWNLKVKDKTPWWKLIITRLLSFSIIASLGFILLVSLLLNALIEGLMKRLEAMFPDLTVIMIYIANLLLTLGITATLFALIFKVLPDARIRWKDIAVGAIFTAVLFMLARFGITFYIKASDMGSTYGAAGSLVVMLVWVYFSATILYFGAEFTRAFAARFGERIHPNQYAVWVKEVQVEEGQASLQHQENKRRREDDQAPDGVKVR